MKKLIPLLLVIVLTLTSCLPSDYDNIDDTPDTSLPSPQSMEELYSLYNAVERGETKAELDARFGEPTPSLDDYGEVKFYTYFNETKSAGVSVIFDFEEKLTTKTLFFNSKHNLVPFSGRFSIDKTSYIKTDLTIEDAVAEMGSVPLELSCRYGNDGPESSKNIYAWYNEDGSSFLMHTNNGLVENTALYKE